MRVNVLRPQQGGYQCIVLWLNCNERRCVSAVQGHALFVRQAGGVLPCPQVDFVGGFNGFFAAAYDLGERSIEEAFGSPFNPFLNDQNFILSVLTLEEFGATGNKVSLSDAVSSQASLRWDVGSGCFVQLRYQTWQYWTAFTSACVVLFHRRCACVEV